MGTIASEWYASTRNDLELTNEYARKNPERDRAGGEGNWREGPGLDIAGTTTAV